MSMHTKSNIDETTFLIIKDKVTNDTEAVVSPSNFQVGLTKSPSDTTLRGRFSINVATYIANEKNNWTVRLDESTTLASIEVPEDDVDKAFTNDKFVTVYLPPRPRTGQLVTVKDFSGVAGKVRIRVYDAAFNLIDGESYRTIFYYYDSLQFFWEGTRWICLAGQSAAGQSRYYANLYDSGNQALTGSNVPQVLDIQKHSEQYGISVVNNNKITFSSAGTYNITFSIEYTNTDNDGHDVHIWFRLNGVDIADSSSRFEITRRRNTGANSYLIAVTPFILTVDAEDYVQIYWTSNSTAVSILAEAAVIGANARPATPSVIVTVQQI